MESLGSRGEAELPEEFDIEVLRNWVIEGHKTESSMLTKQVAVELIELFYAVRDKASSHKFGAGFSSHETGQAFGMQHELRDFLNKYSNGNAALIDSLDVSLASLIPPLSLSAIEPTVVESKLLAESDKELGRTSIDSQGVDPKLDTVSGEVPTVVSKGSQIGVLTSAQGTDFEGRTTANLLPPPSVSVSDSTTAQYPASPGRTSLHASSIASTSQIISLPTAIGIASPLAPVASSIHSLPSSQVEASNVTSSRPSLHNTDLAPPPLDIAAISDQYAALLPLLPADLLRIRLSAPVRTNASGSRKGKEKVTSNGGPDLWRMNVKAVHTGARNFLGKGKRVHNVMSTSDWSVAEEEVRGLRAFERIEQVKAEKAWSFRQPKKQRAGTAPKAHWDHLLDEMRWLHTDFRQERRWKLATAYNIAQSVKAWHRASAVERKDLCIAPRTPLRLHTDGNDVVANILTATDSSTPSSAVSPRTVADSPRKKSMTGNDEMDLDADGEADADGDTEKSRERSMSSFAKVAVAGDAPTTSKPGTATSTPVPEGRLVASSSSISTTPGSHAPIQSDAQKAAQATLLQIQTIMSLRAPIFELPVSATIVDPASLSSPTTSSPGPLSLGTLFPDLPIYSDFQLAADFPSDKRIEESSAWAGRLSNVSKHFDSRPLLVSTVVPSKTRGREGGWDPMTKNWLDEAREIVPDHRDQPVSRSILFDGRKSQDFMNAEPARGPSPVANAAARAVSLFWTTEDDNLLISLHTAYGSNWKLTADVFNRTTNRPSTDYRLPWDLFDRWDRLAGPNSKTILPDGTEISNPLPEYVAPVDKQARPSHYVNLDRAKKQLRHLSVWEAMRRQQKKRESNPKPATGLPRRLNMTMHESHMLTPRPVFSPMEWGSLKLEQDRNKLEMSRRQQQQDLVLQQQRLQQQQQQMMQQQTGGGARYPPPPQGFAQNRSNPSAQQARLGLPSPNGNSANNSAPSRPPSSNGNSIPNGSPMNLVAMAQAQAQALALSSGAVGGAQLTAEQLSLLTARIQQQQLLQQQQQYQHQQQLLQQQQQQQQ